jgi:hypothetical protein
MVGHLPDTASGGIAELLAAVKEAISTIEQAWKPLFESLESHSLSFRCLALLVVFVRSRALFGYFKYPIGAFCSNFKREVDDHVRKTREVCEGCCRWDRLFENHRGRHSYIDLHAR